MPDRSRRLFPALALATAGLVAAGAAAAIAGGTPPGPEGFEVVASGLDNPRDLAFAADGALYVAEAGTATSTCSRERPRTGSRAPAA